MFRYALNNKAIKNFCIINRYRNRYLCSEIDLMKQDINNYIDNTNSFYKLKYELSALCNDDNFHQSAYPLVNNLASTVTDNEIIGLRNIVAYNRNILPFNDFGYYKYPFLETNFLNANLIVWNYNSKTNIHYHPKNGCIIYKIVGKWKEHVFYPRNNLECTRNFIKKINTYKGGDTCFIDNSIGSHKVQYVNSVDYGLSINIYSPGK